MEVVASLSQGRTAAGQCGLFTYKSVPVIFEPPRNRSKAIPIQAVKKYRGSGGIAPLIPKLGTGWRVVFKCMCNILRAVRVRTNWQIFMNLTVYSISSMAVN